MAADLLPGEELPQDGAHPPSLHAEDLSSSHPEHQNEDGVPIRRAYRGDLLSDDGAELCFEEVRAQDFRQRRQKRLDEKRQSLREERTQLELQVAQMTSLLKRAPHQSILEDLASPPRPSCGTSEAQTLATDDSRVEGAAALPERSQPCGLLTRDQDVLPHAQVGRGPPDGGAGSADPRGGLLEPCDVTSWPNFHQETRPLPDIREHGSLRLGGEIYRTRSRLLQESDVLAYEGSQDNHSVIIKVDRRPLAWDFYMFGHLSRNAAAGEPPLVRCHRFRDGCVTVYVAPPSHVFSELSERLPSEDSAAAAARSLLNLTSAVHAGGVAHPVLRPETLISCHPAAASARFDWLFPLDWRAAAEAREDEELVRVGLLGAGAPPQLVDLVGVAQMLHLLLTKRRMVPVRDARGWTAEGFQQATAGARTGSLWCDAFRSLLNADADSWAAVTSELSERLSSFLG
ncbi:mitotic checkpoint serine/threonine-protein kinase BUB1 beta isoform X2 [Hippocampus zosterae]|nr:mitotic checkpoint serine/threonine-protein kinase BUB1 beta isoform X2 [Hippocampus zosterae]